MTSIRKLREIARRNRLSERERGEGFGFGKCGALGRCEAPRGAGLVSEWPERGYCRGSPQGMKAARGLVGVKKVVVT